LTAANNLLTDFVIGKVGETEDNEVSDTEHVSLFLISSTYELRVIYHFAQFCLDEDS